MDADDDDGWMDGFEGSFSPFPAFGPLYSSGMYRMVMGLLRVRIVRPDKSKTRRENP